MKKEGSGVFEEDISRDQLYSSEEVFFTGTAAEIMAVASIDDRTIGTGKRGEITKKLQEKFQKITNGEDRSFAEWLDFVEVKK
jgi:branched-chain amino acid aminotransferase